VIKIEEPTLKQFLEECEKKEENYFFGNEMFIKFSKSDGIKIRRL